MSISNFSNQQACHLQNFFSFFSSTKTTIVEMDSGSAHFSFYLSYFSTVCGKITKFGLLLNSI